MPVKILIEPKVLYFEPEALERWRAGDRDDCLDPYCRRLRGSAGFGEYIAGRHFESLGCTWIHHDFDLFGTNRPGKYPKAEEILLRCLGEERLTAARRSHENFHPFRELGHDPVETPDLLVYQPDGSEIRFAECKRTDTRDQLNRRQIVGLTLIAAVFRCAVDLLLIAPSGSEPLLDPVVVGFP